MHLKHSYDLVIVHNNWKKDFLLLESFMFYIACKIRITLQILLDS